MDFGLSEIHLAEIMTEQEFKDKTKQIALRIIRLVESLPNTHSAQIIGKQLLRSATSVSKPSVRL